MLLKKIGLLETNLGKALKKHSKYFAQVIASKRFQLSKQFFMDQHQQVLVISFPEKKMRQNF